MSKTILVTGAAGFIGYHLAQALHARGDIVYGLDNFNDYYDPLLKHARHEHLQKLGIHVLDLDIADAGRLNSLFQEVQPTHVAHLAAQAGVRYSIDHPQAYVHSNLVGFVNILEACRHYGAPKLIYASSSSVYGANTKIPFSETDKADNPVSLYGATKKANEELAASYHYLYKLCVTGLRFFTVYGPWGRPDMAYYSFTQAISNGEPIRVFNHGQMRRDFTYINDIVHGVIAAIDLGAPLEVFNLGNHEPVALNRFIEIIEDTLGRKAVREELPMQQGDVVETYADITHSQQLLGYTPKTSLEEGLPRFIDWFQKFHHRVQSTN